MKHFYDVGANVGQTFDWYLLKGKFSDHWVTCFEPSPRHTGLLLKKMRTLVGRFRGLTLVPAALDGGTGTARLYQKTTPLSDSLFYEHINKHVANIPPGVDLEVPTLKISDYVMRFTKPDDEIAMKLDAEGAEYAIFQDLLEHPDALRRLKSVLVEWHFDAGSPRTKDEATRLTRELRAKGLVLQEWKF